MTDGYTNHLISGLQLPTKFFPERDEGRRDGQIPPVDMTPSAQRKMELGPSSRRLIT
jgi:hypothetical protein